jgi:hypothetical protein
VQDYFKVNRRLTINLGLRYEFLTDPSEVNGKMADLLNLTDPAPTVLKDHFFAITKRDFAPRIGTAWQLNSSGKTVLRSGFGIFYDHILPYSFATGSSGIPPFFKTLSDLQGPTNQPVFPTIPICSTARRRRSSSGAGWPPTRSQEKPNTT